MKKQPPKSYFTGLRGGFLCSLEFYRTAIFSSINRIGYVHQSTCRHVPNNTLKKVPSLALEDTLVGQRRCFHEALKAATQNMRIYCLNLLNGHKSIVSSSNCSSERCISFSSCRSSSCRGCPSVIRYNERIFISFSYR